MCRALTIFFAGLICDLLNMKMPALIMRNADYADADADTIFRAGIDAV